MRSKRQKISNRLKVGDRVSITWLDACSHDAWTPGHDAGMNPVEVETLGILFEKEKTHLSVVQSIDRLNEAVAGIFCIPTNMIVRAKKLK